MSATTPITTILVVAVLLFVGSAVGVFLVNVLKTGEVAKFQLQFEGSSRVANKVVRALLAILLDMAFLGVWALIQWGVYIASDALADTLSPGFVIAQIAFAIATLLPVVIFIVKDIMVIVTRGVYKSKYFFRSVLALDILWIIGLTYFATRNIPGLFELIALVVGLVPVIVFLIREEPPRDMLRRVVQPVDTNRVLQRVVFLVIPVTIILWLILWLVWPRYDWCDRFNGTEIDGNTWRVQSDPDLINVRGGVLNFEAVAGQSKGEMGGGLIARDPEDREIEEVSFITALKSWEGNGTGGAGVGFNLENGRDIAFKVGSGPDGEPEGEFWACEMFSCGSMGNGDYGEYGTDSSNFRKDGEATPIRVVQTDEGIEFYIDGEHREFYPRGKLFEEGTLFEEATPIEAFGFTMYADEGSQFRLTIDDVCVEYVDS